MPIAVTVAAVSTILLLWYGLTPTIRPSGLGGVLVAPFAGWMMLVALLASLDERSRKSSHILWWGVLALSGFSLLASSIGR